MSRRRITVVSSIIIVIFVVVFFVGVTYMRQPRSGGDYTSVIEGLADVDEVEIMVLESFPVQVNVAARGSLPDSCTEIDEVTVRWKGDAFLIIIATSRPADAVCAQVITPFEEVIPLDMVGLKAGTYTVDVNGVTGIFELQVDNILKEGMLSVSELLGDAVYDTEVRVYGRVSLLGELFCPCFELESGGEKVMVWYGLMVEDDGSERPPVDVEAIDNGDWVVVTGELKSEAQHRSLNDLWAINIERLDDDCGCE